MADKSFEWAKARGRLRTNSTHGEEEAKLILEDWFESKNESGQTTCKTANAEVEDRIE